MLDTDNGIIYEERISYYSINLIDTNLYHKDSFHNRLTDIEYMSFLNISGN